MTIVTTHYRYKRPPRKRKAVVLEGLLAGLHRTRLLLNLGNPLDAVNIVFPM